MLYIQKRREPASLTLYRKTVNAYFDGYQNKDDIRKQLLEEQGYLCAHCMRRIDIGSMKIEHWQPEDVLTDIEGLDYKNMLGVCEGHIDGSKGSDDTCDTHKGNTPIKVDPRDELTLKAIQYRTATGEIYSEDPEIQKDLHITLNLNSERHQLMKNRKDAFNAAIAEMTRKNGGNWNRRMVGTVLQHFQNTDSEGKRKEYAGIVVWFLQKKLNQI